MSLEVMGGLVKVEDVKKIIENKLKMAVLGAMQRMFCHLVELKQTAASLRDSDKKNEIWFLEHNLMYILDITLKYQVKLPAFLENVECPLSNKQMLNYYYKLALEANHLEGKIVPDYGCLVPIEPFLEWSINKEHYIIKDEVDLSLIETHVEGFESQWRRAD